MLYLRSVSERRPPKFEGLTLTKLTLNEYTEMAERFVKTFTHGVVRDRALSDEDMFAHLVTITIIADMRYKDGIGTRDKYIGHILRKEAGRYFGKMCAFLSQKPGVSAVPTISIDSVISESGRSIIREFLAANEDEDNHPYGVENVENLIAKAKLTEVENKYLRLHYYDNVKTMDIARQTGTSKQNVFATIQRALKKLKAVA